MIPMAGTIKIQLKVHNDDINSPTSSSDADKLKFTYLEGSTTRTLDVTLGVSSEGDYKIFELTGLSSFDDPKVTTLKVIPAKDYASSSTNQFLEVHMFQLFSLTALIQKQKQLAQSRLTSKKKLMQLKWVIIH